MFRRACSAQAGTSPRMRGKLPSKIFLTFDTRNIPAHAGKTHPQPLDQQAREEHPRACGENSPGLTHFFALFGTSPRMRGKQGTAPHRAGPHRNIPAHAGKTKAAETPVGHVAEHPRACGENAYNDFDELEVIGTSPRMRGKLRLSLVRLAGVRNIPAHAGKTWGLIRYLHQR